MGMLWQLELEDMVCSHIAEKICLGDRCHIAENHRCHIAENFLPCHMPKKGEGRYEETRTDSV